MSCENISTRKLDYYVNHPDALIIDLRDKNEYENYHILNAVNIPFDEMNRKIEYEYRNNIVADKIYSKNSIIVLYCDRGSKSLMICSKLAKQGYQVKTVIGGISQYRGRFLVKG
jgi:rhodanese-related sulfurtransferase